MIEKHAVNELCIHRRLTLAILQLTLYCRFAMLLHNYKLIRYDWDQVYDIMMALWNSDESYAWLWLCSYLTISFLCRSNISETSLLLRGRWSFPSRATDRFRIAYVRPHVFVLHLSAVAGWLAVGTQPEQGQVARSVWWRHHFATLS